MKRNYSTTPLYKKLGITNNSEILVPNQAQSYIIFFSDFPSYVIINEKEIGQSVEFIHIFVRTVEELETYFIIAKANLKKNGLSRISWPKKSSSMETELNKYMIMNYELDNGLVNTKETSMNENWSGHKFVFRVKDR